jgi:hypothetical protein
VGPGSCDSANEAAGQPGVGSWDAKSDTIGKVSLDRERFVAHVFGDVHSDWEKRRWCRYAGMTIREVNEPKPMFPGLERSYAETLAVTEPSDCQPAVKLTTNAFAPERMALEVGFSRHRVGS